MFLSVYFFLPAFHCVFEYKYSFKPPVLDDSKGIPFFEHLGSVIPDNSRVRIVTSIEYQQGLVQTKSPTSFPWWEVMIDFQVLGSHHIGAEGMAFWFTRNKGTLGKMFGHSSLTDGLAIVLDSHDNDHKNDNPSIAAYVSNETLVYDQANDGGSAALRKCFINYRNTPFPNLLRIQYYKNELTVWYSHGHSMRNGSHILYQPKLNDDPTTASSEVICLHSRNVYLPESGYFGLSAMTGQLGDDHDVHSLIVFSLTNETLPPEQVDTKQKEQYEKMLKEIEKQQSEFLTRTGKNAQGLPEKEDDVQTEDTYSRNLQFIYATNAIFAKQLEAMNNVVLEIRNYLSSINQHKFLPEIQTQLNSLTNEVRRIHENIEFNKRELQEMKSLKSNIQILKSDLHYISHQIAGVNTKHGVSFTTLIVLMILQTVVLIAVNHLTKPNRYRNY